MLSLKSHPVLMGPCNSVEEGACEQREVGSYSALSQIPQQPPVLMGPCSSVEEGAYEQREVKSTGATTSLFSASQCSRLS